MNFKKHLQGNRACVINIRDLNSSVEDFQYNVLTVHDWQLSEIALTSISYNRKFIGVGELYESTSYLSTCIIQLSQPLFDSRLFKI